MLLSDAFELNGELFNEAAAKAVKGELRNQAWIVYENYEVAEEDERTFVVASPRGILDPRDEVKNIYAPLHEPDLVVDLALMADNSITPQAVLVWARQYGLMGFEEDDVVEVQGSHHRVKGYGRRDDVDRFAQAAREVRTCLRIYEALAADTETETLEELIEELWSSTGPLPTKALSPSPERHAGNERTYLLRVLGKMVNRRLQDHCYPKLSAYTREGIPIGRFALSWGFKSLIGAVWLQTAWLLEAEGERVRRCRLPDCARVISLDLGNPPTNPGLRRNARGIYKTRSDRIFCKDRGCKQKYHYRKKAGWPGYE